MENFLKSNFCRTTNTTTNSKYSSARNTIKSSKNKENEQNELKKRRWTTNSWWNEKTPGTKQSPNSRSSVRGNRNVYELSIAPVACISTACANGSQWAAWQNSRWNDIYSRQWNHTIRQRRNCVTPKSVWSLAEKICAWPTAGIAHVFLTFRWDCFGNDIPEHSACGTDVTDGSRRKAL